MDSLQMNRAILCARETLQYWKRAANPGTTSDNGVCSSMTRREVLVLASSAAGFSAGRTTASPTTNSFEFQFDNRLVIFFIGGKETWRIDLSQFGGHPSLQVTKSDNRIQVELSGAFYPGTTLPADLRCDIRCIENDWRMVLQMALGDFRAEVPLVAWLSRQVLARSPMQEMEYTCGTGCNPICNVVTRGDATFSPDWELFLQGPRTATLSLGNNRLISDSFSIYLPANHHASIFKYPAHKRTYLRIDRGQHNWPRWFPCTAPGRTRIMAGNNLFDTLES